MIERKIDTIITDQYGNANYTYTGGGKGKRDIVMKCGKVVSQPVEVWDTLYYDNAKSDDYSDTGWTNNYLNLTRETDAKSFDWTGSGTYGGFYSRNITANQNIAIEFDVYTDLSSSQNIFIITKNNATQGFIRRENTQYGLNLAENTWHHIIIELNNGSGLISNTTNSKTLSFTSTDCDAIKFHVQELNKILKYKNLKIYRI